MKAKKPKLREWLTVKAQHLYSTTKRTVNKKDISGMRKWQLEERNGP